MKTQNNDLHDSFERQQALDPSRSFIVQAPAGSGKTELLTQRFLVLLSHVKQPEEILSITFTKKSAAEMRIRIIHALQVAATTPEPEATHERQTWHLAKKALAQNALYGWNILENPNRLQIQTIDSFNASLTRQLPLLSHFGAPIEILDNPIPLYQEAVQEFLSHLEENFAWSDAIEKLLVHMDNDLSEVEKLLVSMLGKRDQWLPYIISNAGNPNLRQSLECSLQNLTLDTLQNVKQCFTRFEIDELNEILNFAVNNLAAENSSSPILHCANFSFEVNLESKSAWLGLAHLLLTAESSWRKKIDKNLGFPAPSSTKDSQKKSLFSDFKNRLENLLQLFLENDALLKSLVDLKTLPNHYYEEFQWEALEALHEILRILVAQLKVTFQQRGNIDYVENAQAALVALGNDDCPTDLTLALDYKIQHILIDEFQDTSNNQFRLLEKLITGWEPNDGRTLFVVGDPMQSIYRFREAEVGLFIRARNVGVKHLYLESLKLAVNFRSQANIVNWINEHFTKIFPHFEDIISGAITYSSSIAHKQDENVKSHVKLHPLVDTTKEAQADAIIKVIQETRQSSPENKIAILVRSRSHLQALIPALKAAQLNFRAHDIEPLAARPVIYDLLSLTKALLQPADRIAWLSILRAPWCGLSLQDLLVIAGDKTKSILWNQLQSEIILAQVSEAGKHSLNRITPILKRSIAERRRYALRPWVEQTWRLLGGPACLEQAADLEDAEAFFGLLEKLDNAYDLADFQLLTDAVNNLYASPNINADDSLQIMTIHNSKGLEFDTVILPCLEKTASGDKKQLMLWMERNRHTSPDLILAPIQGSSEKENLIYSYIKYQQNIKNDYESARLLYVAATRAKKQLHLFFNLETKEGEIKTPTNNSLLKRLWPAIANTIKLDNEKSLAEIENPLSPQNQILKRLSTQWQNPYQKNNFNKAISYHNDNAGFNLPNHNAKQIGIVMHQILQQISVHGMSWWLNQKKANQQKYLEKQLLQQCMHSDQLVSAITLIEQGITNTLNDERGRWILHPHIEAKSEFAITTADKHLVIDRTFIDENNVRWIIDYKSAVFGGENLTEFLEKEKALYEKQLLAYHDALRAIEDRPIRMALYFPLIPAWAPLIPNPSPHRKERSGEKGAII